jgi:hypothetical protein
VTLAILGRPALRAAAIGVLLAVSILLAAKAEAAWIDPVPLSQGLEARDPKTGIDDQGNVTVAWVSGSSSKDIFVSEHPAGGSWPAGPNSRISDPVGANSCETPSLAVNSAGAAVVVADCGSGATEMRVATRSILGTWAPSSAIPGTGAGSEPRVAIDAAGNVVLVWRGAGSVKSAYRPVAGAWSGVTTLSTHEAFEPNVAISSDGYAFAIWREKREEPIGTDPVIQVEIARKEKAGGWTAHGTLTNNFTSLPITVGEPQVVINPSGQKVVSWTVDNPGMGERPFVQSRSSFSNFAGYAEPARPISEATGELELPRTAITGSGLGVAAWRSFDGGQFRTKAATTSSLAGAWSPVTIGEPAQLNGVGSVPELGVNAAGDAAVVWGSGAVLQAVLRPAGGSFSPVTSVPTAGNPWFEDARVAIDPGGNAIVTWVTSTSPANIAIAVNDVTAPNLSLAPPAPVVVGNPVALTATATDTWSPVTLSWNFGDGGTATGAAVSHAYASAGTKTATVTATDGVGNSSSASATIEVSAPSVLPGGGGSGGSGAGGGGSAAGGGGTPTARHRIKVTTAAVAQSWTQQAKAKALSVKCKLDVKGTCTAVATVIKSVAKKLGLTVPKGRKPVRIGRGSAPATAGRFAVVKVKLNPKALAAIAASAQPVPVAIALEGSAAENDPGTAASRLTLRP